jgi:tRNA (mo5U34)-methyltransferase
MNDRDVLAGQIAALQWYHTIELGGGLVTPGVFDLRPIVSGLGIPERLDGKTVLDVGPGNGFFTFLFEERGAAVTTVELPSWEAHDASPVLKAFYQSDDGKPTAVNIHDALGLAARVKGSRVTRQFVNIYDFDPAVHGRYDIVFCAAVLLHLTDPLRALYRIFSATKEMALVSTPIHDEASAVPRADFRGTATGHTFWLPNRACLLQWARAAGFSRVEWVSAFHLTGRDQQFHDTHGVIRAFP